MFYVNMLECIIQKQICQWLQLNRYFYFSIPNELGGANAAIRTARYKTLGLRSGSPDLCVALPNGLIYFLEVKNEKGKQSDSQIHFESELKKRDHYYFVVRSLDEVIKILNGVKPV